MLGFNEGSIKVQGSEFQKIPEVSKVLFRVRVPGFQIQHSRVPRFQSSRSFRVPRLGGCLVVLGCIEEKALISFWSVPSHALESNGNGG